MTDINEERNRTPVGEDNLAYSKEEDDGKGTDLGLQSVSVESASQNGSQETKKVTKRDKGSIGSSRNDESKSIEPTWVSPKIGEIDQSNDAANDEANDRDTWDNPIEFLLSCISMSVGLGNVWRFPAVAARNGGGAFLIPYLIVLLLIGRPLYYLEMCLGQFSRYGQVKVWNMAPIFKGIGYGSILGVICVCSYYCALMAITVYYFFASFAKTVPWADCHQEAHPKFSCELNSTQGSLAAFYYNSTVFPQLSSIDDGLGTLHWKLGLCLVLSWLLIFLSLAKGVKSSGKVAYFTAIFPYIVLLILLIRGVTLKGLVLCCGAMFLFISHGFWTNYLDKMFTNALIISFMDTFTSLLAGCTIFAVMGNLMVENGLAFKDIEDGPGLAFVLYPQAIAKFGWAPQLFAVLFFLMLFTLGMGSATSLTGGVITIICDQFTTWKRWLVTLVVSICGCLIGLMYVMEGGMFMLDLIDHYGAGFIIYIMAMLECAGVSYIYGLSNFCNDIEFMIGRRPGIYWRACWGFIIPVGLFGNLLYYLISQPEFTSGGVPYPRVATVCGWLLTTFAVGLVPSWGIHAIATRKAGSWKEKFLESLKPTRRWGPQDKKLREEWQEFRAAKALEETKRRFWLF